MPVRVRGMAPWSPGDDALGLLAKVRAILTEYAAYLPLTLRQIFYRLVGGHDYPKDERAYKRLGEMVNRARRADLLDFDAIRDDGAAIRTTMGWASAAALVATWHNDVTDFRLDRQQGQDRRLLIMVEAAGMAPMVAGITAPWSVPVIPSGGFDSTTAKHRLGVSLGEHDGLTKVLHLGDHDPSGVHMFGALAEDVEQFIEDLDLPGRVKFTRLAVTPDHIAAFNLPTAPPKPTDPRSFTGETVQAEAIPPDVLAGIVTDAIEARFDRAAYAAVLALEDRERDRLAHALDRLTDG